MGEPVIEIRAKKSAMLAAFARCGVVSDAARAAGIPRMTHYRWMQDDPEYASGFEDAQGQAADVLEAELVRRAVDGIEEPVWYRGVQCGTVRRYSDLLLIFALKGARPEKYRDTYVVPVNVEDRAKDLAKELNMTVEDVMKELRGKRT